MYWEKVYSVDGFYDDPILGIADLNGKPHIYEAILETPEDADLSRYYLMPAEADLIDIVLEAGRLHRKWVDGCETGEDKARNEALQKVIRERVKTIPEESVIMEGSFNLRDHEQDIWEVHWRQIRA